MRHVLYEAFRQYMMNLGRDVKAAKRRGACVRVPTAAQGLMRGPGRIAGSEPSSSKAPNAAPSSTDGAVTTSLERVGETPTEPPMSVPQHLPIQIEISSELLSGIADACMTLSKVHQLLSKATVTRRAAADPATDSAPAPSCSQAGGGGWFGSDRAWARASNTALSSDVSSNLLHRFSTLVVNRKHACKLQGNVLCKRSGRHQSAKRTHGQDFRDFCEIHRVFSHNLIFVARFG